MKIIYVANDGKYFDDKYDCEEYEWKLDRKGMDKGLHMYDIEGNELTDYLVEDTYNNVVTIAIDDANALEYIQDVAKYTGFCEYNSIDKCGLWKYEDNGPEYAFFGGHFEYLGPAL